MDVRKTHQWICAHNPDCLKFSSLHCFDHLCSRKPWFGRDGIDTPKLGNFFSVRVIGKASVSCEHSCKASYFASTHRVWLPREREGTGPRLANFPSNEIQANQCKILFYSNRTLVEPHRP